MKREESYDLAAGFPKTSKFVHWVTSATVQAYLDKDIDFFDGLEHNIEQPLPAKVKKHSRVTLSHCNKNMRYPTLFGLAVSNLLSILSSVVDCL